MSQQIFIFNESKYIFHYLNIISIVDSYKYYFMFEGKFKLIKIVTFRYSINQSGRKKVLFLQPSWNVNGSGIIVTLASVQLRS